MAEKEKDKKGKKSIFAIITAILVPILIVVMTANIFYIILEVLLDIVIAVVEWVINELKSLFKDPIKYVSSRWATFTNFLDRTIGVGDEFNEKEYEDARDDLNAYVVIKDTQFQDMKSGLEGKISMTAAGLDDITIKKMLLAYYRGIYLTDTYVLMELTDEELKENDNVFKPFSKVEGDKDAGKGEDGKTYLQAKGMIEIKTDDDENLVYYPLETLTEIYNKHYLDVVDDNEDYAESVLEYLEKCYTYGDTGIKIYAVTTDKVTETWKYENSKRTLIINKSSPSTANLTTVDFYDKVAEYVTPVEFMIDMMEITGCNDFINAFIETVGTKTKIEMEIAKVYNKEETEETEERTRSTTIIGEKGDDYNYTVKKADGTVISHTVEEIEGTNEVNITVNSNGTDCMVTLYTNDIPEKQKSTWTEGHTTHTELVDIKYKLNKDNNWTHTWSNKIKSDKTTKEKQDTSKVIHTTTTTHKENKYDLAITKVTTWYTKITQDNSKNTDTTYTTITEENSEVGIDNEEDIIIITQSDESNEYTSTTDEDIFIIKESYNGITSSDLKHLRFTMEECLNFQFNYIINLEESDYDLEDYTFTKMTSNDTQIKKSTLKTTTIKSFKEGTQTVEDNTDLFLGLLSNEYGYYVNGADFKAKSSGGKVVEYPDLYRNIADDSVAGVGELLENGAEMLFTLLEKSKNTQGLVDDMKWILYRYSGVSYGITDYNQLDTMYNNMSSVGKDFTVTVDDSNSELVLDKQTILDTIDKTNYSENAKKNLKGVIDDLIYIQENNKINAVFAIAVTILESSAGTNWNAIDSSTYNWMSVTGTYNGNSYKNPNSSNPRTWRKYSSFNEATRDFGDLIANGDYYVQAGKTTVKQIAPTYCNERWGTSIISIMADFYEKAGISINKFGNEEFVQVAKSCHDYLKENNYYYVQGSNIPKPYEGEENYIDCSAYVTWVLYEYGYTELAGWQKRSEWFVNENNWQNYGWEKIEISKAMPGDIVVRDGHVEIYYGDGKFLNCGSTESIRREYDSYSNAMTGLNRFTFAIRVQK